MKSLFKKRDHYKPFDYPWAYDAFVKSEQMHWLAREVPLNEDVKDWRARLSESEKTLLTQIFRFFTQADVDVAGAYIDRYMPVFQPPEIRMMLSSIAAREAVHVQAYSMLIDEIGMPESEYSSFMQYEVMRKKHEEMSVGFSSTALEIVRTSAFGEGLQLFASFVILLNFTRFGKMKGMGQIVSWSIRDETHHVDSMIRLFDELCTEEDSLFQPTRGQVELICRNMVDLEDKFIDLAFATPEAIEGLSPEEVKRYIRYIADLRLHQLGYQAIYNVPNNPLSWVDTIVFGKEHTNFFENRATDYAKGTLTGDWDGAFDFSESSEGFIIGEMAAEYTVLSKPDCPWCERAKELLASRGAQFDVREHETEEEITRFKSFGFKTFPQIMRGNVHLGGFEDLQRYFSKDKGLAGRTEGDNIAPVIPAPQEGASCSLEGDCS